MYNSSISVAGGKDSPKACPASDGLADRTMSLSQSKEDMRRRQKTCREKIEAWIPGVPVCPKGLDKGAKCVLNGSAV
jgi:hypothetical protein